MYSIDFMSGKLLKNNHENIVTPQVVMSVCRTYTYMQFKHKIQKLKWETYKQFLICFAVRKCCEETEIKWKASTVGKNPFKGFSVQFESDIATEEDDVDDDKVLSLFLFPV